MGTRRGPKREVAVGFAADGQAWGVAYARVRRPGGARVLRIPFAYGAKPALQGREVGFAALAAVSASLQRLGCERVCFAVDDTRLVEDLRARNEIPSPLAVEYVRLRCRLNGFRTYEITHAVGSDGDLAARARSETAMRIAA